MYYGDCNVFARDLVQIATPSRLSVFDFDGGPVHVPHTVEIKRWRAWLLFC